MQAFCKSVGVLFILCCLALGCDQPDSEHPKSDCLSQQPGQLKGLTVNGARSYSNVVHELWKVICRMRAYHRIEKPQIEGSLKAAFTVDFNGEMGRVNIIETDIQDQAFTRKIIELIEAAEFSFWGEQREDTDIVYTFVFKQSA